MNKKVIDREKKNWQLNAEFYARIADSPYQKYFDQKILENYGMKLKKPFLEIGAGVGNFSKLLDNPVFIDFSSAMIKMAKKRVKGKGVVCPAHQLPFKNKEFKTVFVNDTFHHLKGQNLLKESLEEIGRVTKEESYLCFTDRAPNFLGNGSALFFTFLKKIVARLIGKKSGCGTEDEPAFTKKEYQLIEKSWKPKRIVYWRTLPTYFFTVFTHQLAQLGFWNACFKIQRKTLSLIKFLERYFNWSFFCTEVSIKAAKK